MTTDLSGAVWRKSSRSANDSDCVEIADLGEYVALRNAKSPDGPVLVFTAFEWDCFLDGVEKHEFQRG